MHDYYPTFEEVLGLLEMANMRGEFFKSFGGLQQETTRGQEMRAHLVYLIAVVLDKALGVSSRYHSDLVCSCQRHGWFDSINFISLNYDLLIDNALQRGSPGELNYAVKFRSISPRELAILQTPRTTPTLLKLHGSLNWLYCPTCNELDCFPGEKIVADIAHDPHRITCNVCQEPRVPIIIPPTFFKVMSNFYLQQIWKTAEIILREAQHIVFCGYSFPDADLHFKYLLKRAEINRNGDPPEVFVINEHPGKNIHQREEEKSRYLRFFRNKGLVHYTNLSFEDFAADPNRYAEPTAWI
jgi:hypothetical protein